MPRKFSHLRELQEDFCEACLESYIAHKNYGQFKSEEFRQKAEETWDKCVDRYSTAVAEICRLQDLNPEEDDLLRILENDRADICKRFDSAKEQHYDLFDSDEGSDSSPSEDDDDLVSISNEEPEEYSVLGTVKKSITGMLGAMSQRLKKKPGRRLQKKSKSGPS